MPTPKVMPAPEQIVPERPQVPVQAQTPAVQPAERPFEIAQGSLPPVEMKDPGPLTPVAVAVQPAEQPKVGPVIPLLPQPRPLNPFDPIQVQYSALGKTPQPDAKVLKKFGQYVTDFGDPENTLDLVQGRTRLMMLTGTPKRIQIADESMVSANLIGTKDITLLGKTVGSTTLSLWFPSVDDKTKEVVLHYLVRVWPDPEEEERLRRKYKALEIRINRTFSDSVIHLELVGTKVVVTGMAHDIRDATEILRLVSANVSGGTRGLGQDVVGPTIAPANVGNTPGLENNLSSNNANVINMLNISGVQQVKPPRRRCGNQSNRGPQHRPELQRRESAGGSGFSEHHGIHPDSLRYRPRRFRLGQGNGYRYWLYWLRYRSRCSFRPVQSPRGPGQRSNHPGHQRPQEHALRQILGRAQSGDPNGKAATFQAGGEFPVPVVTANGIGGLGGVSFVPYGVQLNFTPFITDKDRIRLQASVTISTSRHDDRNDHQRFRSPRTEHTQLFLHRRTARRSKRSLSPG